jgi:regulatory protein YycI of two-component signal transduction system YycFG
MTVENAITDIRFGYYSATEFPAGWYLAPVWRIHSIRAIFYINALNGEVEVAKNVE